MTDIHLHIWCAHGRYQAMRGWARLMWGTRQPAPAPDVCVIAVCMQASKDAAIAEGADLAKGQKLSHQQAEAAARRAVRIEEKAARARESRMLAGVFCVIPAGADWQLSPLSGLISDCAA